MARKTKAVEVKIAQPKESVMAVAEVAVPAKSGIDIERLKALVWNAKLEDIQEAVAEIKDGDAGTMSAVKSVLAADNTGIASQYLQQIIQRNS